MRHQPDPAQGALFPPEPERRHAIDPHIYLRANPHDTEVQAAAAALPRTGTQRDRVFQAIRRANREGRTDEELALVLGVSLNSVRPRRLELVEDGLVVDSGERRETAGGNPAIVWMAKRVPSA